MLQRELLPNDIWVVGEELEHYHSVSIGVWVSCGSSYESRDNNGISHFVEHLLFKGTEKRSASQIVGEIEEVGGSIDGFTSREFSGYWVKIPSSHLEKALDILSDLLLHPRFAREDFEKEKEVIIEEIKSALDNPQEFLSDSFTQNFWEGSPWGFPILGREDSVSRFSLEEVRNFYLEHYFNSPFIISLAGDFKFKEVLRTIEEKWGGIRWGRKKELPPPTRVKGSVFTFPRNLEQVHFILGTPGVSQKTPLRFAFLVMESILGGGMSSRLFQRVREEFGLVYEIFTFHLSTSTCGLLGIYGGSRGEKVRDAVRLILEEMRNMKEGKISEEEVEKNKEFLKGGIILSSENTQSRMSRLANQQFYFGRIYSLEEVIERIERVKVEEVRKVAEKIFGGDSLNLAFLGRGDILEDLKKVKWNL